MASTKRGMTAKEKAFYKYYNQQLINGTADPKKLGWYNAIMKATGTKGSTISNSKLQELSIKALSGDKKAQQYLKSMHYNALTGSSLWKGYDTKNLAGASESVRSQYMKDNPLAQYTKDYDMKYYNQYNDMINGNKPMTAAQNEWYQRTINKWNLDDNNDPLVQQKLAMEKDKQNQLNAQDVALNQGLAGMDANNFNAYQAASQNMADRGMGSSGIAQDAYNRLTMSANQNYQQAYSESVQNKANINTQYTANIGQLNAQIAQQKQAQEAAKAEAQAKQDQFLTAQTGVMYANGKPMKDSKGNVIRTLDWYKMTESQRHNLAMENNAANSNIIKAQDSQLDYQLGMTKVQADIQKSQASLKLGYDKLDLAYAKYEADLNKAREQLTIAARNASSKEQANMINGINKQIAALQKQIKAQKDGKATKEQKAQLKKLMGQLDSVLGK